jgi:serine/threonine protein kinase
MLLKPGVRVGAGLRLVRPLGEGAMGSVWEAERPEGDRVAVKFAAKHMLKDPTDRARFSREATLANQLDSPHIVESQGFGITEDATPYIVMELLKGETLADRLRRDRVIGPFDLVKILSQMASALDEAHGLGIIHRDVKPDNVFLAKTKSGEVFVKMLDFGMAKRTNVANPSVVTEEGTSVGTPDFMSPEQLRTASQVDHKTDIWAIGVLSYRALIGRLPFVSTTFAGLCVAICEGRYTKPSELAPNLPAAVDDWFACVLAVDREDRYDTADETVVALKRALAIEVEVRERESRKKLASLATIEEQPPSVPMKSGGAQWLDWAIALLVGFTALCVGALLASMDGF